ncbi:2-hydroxyacyl-CoA dehydratase [Helicovermis profundi]|uniref:Acyl-CoA dehydratase activase-related protein n=1 Tax=Helicovermis profundi TaxID=3065157 RepID=A0AAU9EJD3_9FIRM|nr:acyl-CoA dehydratase activase-related protein [Clostridia bacterium S502]
MKKIINVGIDVGSTTIKVVVLENDEIVFSEYKRHFSDIKNASKEIINKIIGKFEGYNAKLSVTGSAGMMLSDRLSIEFIQEVIASSKAITEYFPKTDVAIELGGEDAKITYFGATLDQRMNGVCAGGTGAFIDQMALLLDTDGAGLNELAKKATTIYSIASRCGVFAKSDVQPLLNEGTPKEDIALSVFQAVVNQTIGGLASGKPIRGNVAFLGGPLFFLSELRKQFIETLNLTEDEIIFPKNAQYFVALGAALYSKDLKAVKVSDLTNKLLLLDTDFVMTERKLEPLFKSEEDYKNFLLRQSKYKVKRGNLESYKGKAYLGIDAGSTTTKVVLIGEEKELLYSYYDNNLGSPLDSAIKALKDLYKKLNKDTVISKSSVTGYGENLLKSALKVDIGEIETIAHYKGAEHFQPNVDFIIDIGGQDMKSMKIKNGFVESIMLNEACSSGCGSFIETFAKSLGISISEFVKEGVNSKEPVDLGSRCTVFMNSKVKQVQKEGATVGDIAAGISYSVIKNALYKVIRLKNSDELGDNIVVQGGTFYNDAVLKSFELITGKEVIRPDIAGTMGAFGAAIIAHDDRIKTEKSSILSLEELENFSVKTSHGRCKLCGNKCLLTINVFDDNRKFISGNRCERGLGNFNKKKDLPNLYEYKCKRVFGYKSLDKKEAPYGVIGIPRGLNIYENYPFWHTLFSELGYSVLLSSRSSRQIFSKGIESIPSDSVCYPAKLMHGHIEDLLEKGVKRIFYPSIPFEIDENKGSDNNFNCPIVTSYPESIKANVEKLNKDDIEFINPFLPLYNEKQMKKVFFQNFSKYGHTKNEINIAISKAYAELKNYKNDVRNKGEEVLKYIKDNNLKGIVLAGRPYHIDPEINHGIPSMITGFGLPVLSEDSISHLSTADRPLRVVDQWTYHSRLYDSASFVAKNKNLEMVQFNSFGCGLDAVTTDQVKEILEKNARVFTSLKIDEINSLGAARIRIRSLIALMKEKEFNEKDKAKEKIVPYVPVLNERVEFTKEMKKRHTILCPQMSPIHFRLLKEGFNLAGYNFVVIEHTSKEMIDEGLRVVNNDACFPSIIVVGQLLDAIKSGKYDLNNVSIMISQTGGGCRATNYIGFIRKALKDSKLGHIPVISLNMGGLEKNSGFKITLPMIKRLTMALIYGDLLMRVLYRVRPYELVIGSANKLYEKWNQICIDSLKKARYRDYIKNIKNIVKEFDEIAIREDLVKSKVGIVGEILVKFHPYANNDIVNFLESEGVEAVMPDLTDFMLYSSYNTTIRRNLLAASYYKKLGGDLFIKYLEFYRKHMKKSLLDSKRFNPPKKIAELAKSASKLISLGHQTGEGWFLTAEIIELLESGVSNVVILQPFGCLPNHVTGKGVIKLLKSKFVDANIAAIDYDPGASEVNQINRIKLMLSNAKENIINGDS